MENKTVENGQNDRKKKILCIFCVLILLFICFVFRNQIFNFCLNIPTFAENVIQKTNVAFNDVANFEGVSTTLDNDFPKSSLRQDFTRYSDKDFANFRCLKSLGLKDNMIFRSSSPVDNTNGRAVQAHIALEQSKIHNIINLVNNREEAKNLYESAVASTSIAGGVSVPNDFENSYYAQQNVLYVPINLEENGLICADGNNKEQIKKIFEFIAQVDGPVLIHCEDGGDKTAFVCFLLSSLTCSSYDYIKADYYQSNYCLRKVNDGQNTTQMRALIDAKLRTLIGFPLTLSGQSIISSNLNTFDKAFLNSCGVSNDVISAVYEKISDV